MFIWVILQIPNNMIGLFWLIAIDWQSIIVYRSLFSANNNYYYWPSNDSRWQ